jgi:hypothetical protein
MHWSCHGHEDEDEDGQRYREHSKSPGFRVYQECLWTVEGGGPDELVLGVPLQRAADVQRIGVRR